MNTTRLEQLLDKSLKLLEECVTLYGTVYLKHVEAEIERAKAQLKPKKPRKGRMVPKEIAESLR